MARLRVGVWQCAPTPDQPRENLRRLHRTAIAAADRGVRLLITPELTLTGYDVPDLSALVDGQEIARLSDVAVRHALALVAGVATKAPDGTLGNEAVLVGPGGQVLSRYRKAHLFGGFERRAFAAGSQPFGLGDVDGVRIATMVCYDVEFPEAVRAAALAGAHLVAVPTANMYPFDIVNEHVIPARAWENQVYLAYANRCGEEGRTGYVGRSVLAGPDGRPLAGAGADGEELLVADIDTTAVDIGRRRNPYLRDRRPEIYDSAPEQAHGHDAGDVA